MNKKGLASAPIVFLSIIALNIGVIFGGGFCVESFRARKATEKCVAGGNSQGMCETFVSNMSREDVLGYIKDK